MFLPAKPSVENKEDRYIHGCIDGNVSKETVGIYLPHELWRRHIDERTLETQTIQSDIA